MYHKTRIANTTDTEYLRCELANSQKLNQELHRRLQCCEGADSRLKHMRDSMENNFEKHCKMWRDRTKYWKQQASNVEHKLYELPFFVKWFIK